MASNNEIIELLKEYSKTDDEKLKEYLNKEESEFKKLYYRELGKDELPLSYNIIYDNIKNEESSNNHPGTTQEIADFIVEKTGLTFEQILNDQKLMVKMLNINKKQKIPIEEIISYVPNDIQQLINKYIVNTLIKVNLSGNTYVEDNLNKCASCNRPIYTFNMCRGHFYRNSKNIINDIQKIARAYMDIKKIDELCNLITYNILSSVKQLKINKKTKFPFTMVERQFNKTKIVPDILDLLYSVQLKSGEEVKLINKLNDTLKEYPINMLNNYLANSNINIQHSESTEYDIVADIIYNNNKSILSKVLRVLKQFDNTCLNKAANNNKNNNIIIDTTDGPLDITANINGNINKIITNAIETAQKGNSKSYIVYEEVFRLKDKYLIKNLVVDYDINKNKNILKKYPYIFASFPIYGEIYNNEFSSYIPFVITFDYYKHINIKKEKDQRLRSDMILESFCFSNSINYLKLKISDMNINNFIAISEFFQNISSAKKIFMVNTLDKTELI